MNWFKIISDIEKADPEIIDRLDTRRKAMRDFGNMGAKITAAALPLAISSMFTKAYGKTNDIIVNTLNFALALEYLEAEFYTQGLAGTFIPAGPAKVALTKIRDDENKHVEFLKAAITGLGGVPDPKPNIDLTGGKGVAGTPGLFAAALTNYDIFLAVAQTFEDTGVRAYKGQAGNLVSNNDILTAALKIHSVEARHASHIRQMRATAAGGSAAIDPWITLKGSGIIEPYGSAVQPSYNGEEVTNQASVNIAAITSNGITISAETASEAFDEPLTKEQVLLIVGTPGAGMGTATAAFFY